MTIPLITEARMAERRLTYGERAQRIVDRVLPVLPSANPLYDADGFVAASRRHSEREELYWLIFARLRAKAEGGVPRIALPVGHSGYGPMARVAARLSDAELVALSHGHRRFQREMGRG